MAKQTLRGCWSLGKLEAYRFLTILPGNTSLMMQNRTVCFQPKNHQCLAIPSLFLCLHGFHFFRTPLSLSLFLPHIKAIHNSTVFHVSLKTNTYMRMAILIYLSPSSILFVRYNAVCSNFLYGVYHKPSQAFFILTSHPVLK